MGKAFIIAHNGRNNAGRPHGWRGNDLPAASIFLSNGKTPQINPINHIQRIIFITQESFLKPLIQLAGAALDIEAAGQHAAGFDSAL